MPTTDLQAIIEQAITTRFAPLPIARVDVEPRDDNNDEEALFITVTLPAGTGLVPGHKLVAAISAASNALLKQGDRRFPYVRTIRADDAVDEETGPQP